MCERALFPHTTPSFLLFLVMVSRRKDANILSGDASWNNMSWKFRTMHFSLSFTSCWMIYPPVQSLLTLTIRTCVHCSEVTKTKETELCQTHWWLNIFPGLYSPIFCLN